MNRQVQTTMNFEQLTEAIIENTEPLVMVVKKIQIDDKGIFLKMESAGNPKQTRLRAALMEGAYVRLEMVDPPSSEAEEPAEGTEDKEAVDKKDPALVA